MAEFQYLDQGNSEAQDRLATSFLFAPSGTDGIAATGVLAGLMVYQSTTPNAEVYIFTGAGVVQSSLSAGVSVLVSEGRYLDVLVAHPVGGLPRNDIVEFDSITASLIVHVGVPNATPTDPTVPNTSVALARLRHGAGATTIPNANIDDLRVFTTLRGVVVLPDPKHNVTQSGNTLVTLNSVGNQAIYYPLPYATPPVVVAWNGDSNAGGGEVFSNFVGTGGETHFNVHSSLGAPSARRVLWIAVGDLA